MARDIVNAEIARQREAELRRHAQRYAATRITPRTKATAMPREAVTIRLAAPDDGRELDLLARRHGARVPAGPSLIAELGGRPVAAMSLLDRTVMVDPGELTRDVVELLRLRAAQLLGDARDRRLSFGSIAVLARSVIARR
jgi:hypothetical protein